MLAFSVDFLLSSHKLEAGHTIIVFIHEVIVIIKNYKHTPCVKAVITVELYGFNYYFVTAGCIVNDSDVLVWTGICKVMYFA